MSAYMMPAKTTVIIAEYLANAATSTEFKGMLDGIRTIQPPKDLLEVLKAIGCYDEHEGEYRAVKIYEVLARQNATALRARYRNRAEEMIGTIEPFYHLPIDTKETTRREWLANLFTVSRCYLYQCCEGTVPDTDFYKAFGKWVDKMAFELAEMVVREFRPMNAKPHKPWDQF